MDNDFFGFIYSAEVYYIALILALFVVPQVLARYMIPPALTAFGFGTLLGYFSGSSLIDPTVNLLSTIGISSLFLFAGLEIEFSELKQNRRFLLQHVFLRALLLFVATFFISKFTTLGIVSSGILALALFTPSTGFILDNLKNSHLDENGRKWVRLQAIASEIIALILMFVLMRSRSTFELIYSSLGLATLILLVPLIFKGFAKFIIPHAPGSDFAFLVMFAVLAGLITKNLGAYYLVGAFVVGVGAKRFEKVLPSIASESIVSSLRNFSAFFMPFYFFHAGMGFSSDLISMKSLFLGSALVLVVGFIRTFLVCLHRKISLSESLKKSFPISVTLLPTLVFGLVLAGFLEKDPLFPKWIIGGLVTYTLIITSLPPVLMLIADKRANKPLSSVAQ